VDFVRKIVKNLKEGLSLGPTFPLRHISGLFGREYHATALKGIGPVYMRPKSSDAATFSKVFLNREYDISRHAQFPRVVAAYQGLLDAGQVPVIIDAGANVGAASIWFSKVFPQAQILAIEPDAANAEVCRLNTKSLRNVKVIEAAIGSEPGLVSLSNPSGQAWAVQTTRSSNTGVPVRTIADLLREVSPAKLFVVKIDIEGFEEDLFSSNTEWVDEVEVIIIEPHDWMCPGKGTSFNFQQVLGRRAFELLISGENLIYIRLGNQRTQ